MRVEPAAFTHRVVVRRRRSAGHPRYCAQSLRHRLGHGGARLFCSPTSTFPTSTPTICSTATPRSPSCAGFAYNRRVMITGYHGTGKSTHIEQVAARLNWPLVRINLDSHVSRIDLVGKDAIVLKDGKQVTEFRDGMLPWALQNNIALCFDEYDAGRPDVMFVIQRVLEVSGRLTLLDQRRVIRPHPGFRLFATANTDRSRRHLRPLSRHAADQPGPDGPLVDRHHAELSAA